MNTDLLVARHTVRGDAADEAKVSETDVAAIQVPAIEYLSETHPQSFPDEWYELATSRHFWLEWRFRVTLRLLRSLGIPTETRLQALEVGCGKGALRDQLEAHTRWTVDGTDLNVEALRRAGPARGRTLFYDITERHAAFAGAYDLIILFDVLEHIEATGPFLDAFLWHLRPGGYFLVNVPAMPALFSAYDMATGHVRRYAPSSLRAEFGGGLEVLGIRYWGLSLVPLLWIRKQILRGVPDTRTIRTGFRPPGSLAHAILRGLMRLELALVTSPPLGSSLLLAGRKRR